MRVLWVIKGLGPGGAERLLCTQARARTRTEFDIECAYVVPYKDHLADELEHAGVRTHCVSRSRWDPLWPKRLFDLVRDGSWDVLHVHSPLPATIARVAVLTMPREDRPAIVSTEHNRWETFHPLTRFVNELTSNLDDATIAVSGEVAQSMTGPARRRVQVLRHGIDVERISHARASRTAMRRDLGIAPNDFVVGTVANFRAQKDYPNLLAAAKQLSEEGSPIRFVAVGQGPEEDEIRRLHRELGLGSKVVLTGFRDDAVHVMAACDAFVLASKWEGLPVAVMEACALGLPIVATNVGGLAEEFVDEETALLVPPSDSAALAVAIQRIHDDHLLAARLAAAATASAVRFDVRRTQHVLEDTYRRVSRHDTPVAETSISGSVPSKARTLPDDIVIRPATSGDRDSIIDLCRVALGWDDDPRFSEMFAWKHDLNPFGSSTLLVAERAGRLLGVRAFMRWQFERGGSVLPAARAVDTATHPDAQGQGLFTALTLDGLRALEEDGVEFVFNTPNDRSRPGYLKMGWQDVGRLPIAARIIRPDSLPRLVTARTAASHWPTPTTVGLSLADAFDDLLTIVDRDRQVQASFTDVRTITTNITADYLRWRYGSPLTGARLVVNGAGGIIISARQRGEALECSLLDSFALSQEDADRAAIEAARDMGADYVVRTGEACLSTGFVPIPGFGPQLTWRSVSGGACPPLANWSLRLGTIAFF